MIKEITKEKKDILHDLIFDGLEGWIVPASVREAVAGNILKGILEELGD